MQRVDLMCSAQGEAMSQALRRVLALRFRHPWMLAGRLESWMAAAGVTAKLGCNLLYLRFQCLEVLGRAEPLMPLLSQFQVLALNEGWNAEQALLLCAMGRLAYSRGAYQDAAQHWSTALHLAHLAAARDAEVEARVGLGQIYDALGNGRTAARLHGDAEELADALHDDYLISKVAINKGFNLRVIEQIEPARSAFLSGLEAATRGQVRHFEAESLWQLADLSLQQGDLPPALEWNRKAERLARAADNRWLLSGIHKTQAQLLARLGRRDEAAAAFRLALDYANKTGARRQAADCLEGLALIAEQNGDLAAALKHTRQAKALQAELLGQLHVAENLDALRQYDLSEPPPLERMLMLSGELQLESQDLSTSLDRLCQVGPLVLHADAVLVCEWQGQQAEVLAASSAALPASAAWARYARTVFQAESSSTETRVLHDVRTHPLAAGLRGMVPDLGSVIEVPLWRHGGRAGLLLVARRQPPQPWSRHEVLLASHLGALSTQLEAAHQSRLARQALELANQQLEQRVAERTAELELLNHALALSNEALNESALTDPLTGLRNRRFLEEHLEADLALALREAGQDGGLLLAYLIDIDHFKHINDRHGHELGDRTLVEAARRLQSINRRSSHLVRLGGEEFLMVARHVQPDQAGLLAERICAAFNASEFELDGHRLRVTCSVGFAAFPMPRVDGHLAWNEVMALADQAMYRVKAGGRNGWLGVLPAPTCLLPAQPLSLDEALAQGLLRSLSSSA